MPALKVSSDQRAELRSQAHALKPVVLVGAEGLTDAVLSEIKVHLGAHQLIKIRVFGDEREERIAIYEEICDKLNAAPIQHIGKLLVIWDGAPIHRAQVVRDFLAQGGAARIWLEQLPAYAPELNPEEGIWNLLKRAELRNVCCDDLAELRRELRYAAARLRHRATVIRSCVTQCGYSV